MRTRSLFLASSAIVAAVVLAGCSGKPENSPVIRKKFAELDTMNQKVDDVQVSVKALTTDIQLLSNQLSEVRALNPDTAGGTDIIKRIESLESSVKSGGPVTSIASSSPTSKFAPASMNSNTELSTLDATLAKPAAVTAEPTVTKVSNNIVADVAKKAVAETTKKETTKPVAKKATTKSTPKSSPGRYYPVKSGDSIDSIAKANGVSVDAILKANKLPAGAKVPAGQSIYIPGK